MKKRTISIKYKNKNIDDTKICWALMSSFLILTLQYLVLIYFNLLETIVGSNIQLLSKGFVGLAYLYALPAVLRRKKKIFGTSYIVAVVVFSIHYLCFPENRIFMLPLIIPFFFMVLPSFIYALSIRNFVIFKNVLEKSSCIVFFIGSILSLFVFLGRASIGSYSMSLAYYMLLPSIVFLNNLFERISAKYFILLVLSLIVIISLGSRGPILCLLVFVFLRTFRPSFRTSYKKIIMTSSVLGICTVGMIFFKNIINVMYNQLSHYGFHSRTLYLFLNDRGVYLSGRSSIYQSIIAEILKNPILGIGLAGDRRITDGTYAHNIYIELISNFGFILGFILILLITFLVIKSLFIKDDIKYILLTMWFCLGFIPLLISGSYLTSINFAIFLGVVIHINKDINNNVRYNKHLS